MATPGQLQDAVIHGLDAEFHCLDSMRVKQGNALIVNGIRTGGDANR
jgi:hypothetical protein